MAPADFRHPTRSCLDHYRRDRFVFLRMGCFAGSGGRNGYFHVGRIQSRGRALTTRTWRRDATEHEVGSANQRRITSHILRRSTQCEPAFPPGTFGNRPSQGVLVGVGQGVGTGFAPGLVVVLTSLRWLLRLCANPLNWAITAAMRLSASAAVRLCSWRKSFS